MQNDRGIISLDNYSFYPILQFGLVILWVLSGCVTTPTKDLAGPHITIKTPPPGATSSQPRLVVSGIASDPSQVVRLLVQDQPAELQPLPEQDKTKNYSWQVTVTLHGGNNQIVVQAWDSRGNSSQKSIEVTFKDKLAPAILIRRPRNYVPGKILSSDKANLELAGEIIDHSPVELKINGKSYKLKPANSPHHFSFTARVPLTAGMNDLLLQATDKFGNTSTPLKLKVNYIKPVLQIEPQLVKVVAGKNVFLKVKLVRGDQTQRVTQDLVWQLEQGSMEGMWYHAPDKVGQYQGQVQHTPTGARAVFQIKVVPEPPKEIRRVYQLRLKDQESLIGKAIWIIEETPQAITETRTYELELLGGLLKQKTREVYVIKPDGRPWRFECYAQKSTPEDPRQETHQKGSWRNGELIITENGEEHRVSWQKDWLLPVKLAQLLRKKGLEIGKQYTLPIFFPTLNNQEAMQVQVAVRTKEQRTYDGAPVTCYNVVLQFADDQYPIDMWLDEHGVVYQQTCNIAGITLTADLAPAQK